MSLTQTEHEIFDYCRRNEFVSSATLEYFVERLNAEGNLQTLSFALEKFRDQTCPNCNAGGAYKWHFMGKHNHPDCGFSWYISPGAYTAEQFKGVFRSGVSAAVYENDQKGDKSGGCLYAILSFMFVSLFRLVFAILMIPIQAIFSLTQSKPENSTAVKQ
jgi:hypothetical protein